MLTPVKWAGISQLNNFQYESGSIKVWRISCRSRISEKGSSHEVNKASDRYKGFETFSHTRQSKRRVEKASFLVEKSTISEICGATYNCEETESPLYSCPDEGCTKVYRSNRSLVSHLDFGKHQYKLHRETQDDHIRRQWRRNTPL